MTVAERVPSAATPLVVGRADDALAGLGALAVTAVVASAWRVPGFSGGWIGLEVAFVLLGFGSTRALTGRLAGERRWLLGYLRQLAVAVVPPTVVVAGFALVWTFVQDGALTAPVRGAAIAVVGQFYDVAVVAGRVDARAFGAWWPVSLAVQAAVLTVPLVAGVRRWPARRVAHMVAVVAVLGVLARIVMIGAGGAPSSAVRLPWFHADGFLIGVAAGLVHRRLVVTERQWLYRASVPSLVAVAVLVVVVPWTLWDESTALLVVPVVAVLAGALVLGLAARSAPAHVVRSLSIRPLVWLGRRSFGLFLWHHPVGLMLVAGGQDRWDGPWLLVRQLALTVVLAVASYEFIERPIAHRLNRP